MKTVTYSDPRARLVFVLATIALVVCACSLSQLPENKQTCLPAQDRPSCFYPEVPKQKKTKLIIFVHGIFGGATTTWGDPRKETFWPAMVAKDPRFTDCDIYLINYHTPYIGQAPNIHEIAGNELGRLLSRKVFDTYDDIYVIAHSMGGLVTKSMLTRLNRGQDVAHLRRVKGVVYLSTPAQGADAARLTAWFSLNPQLGNMERASLNAYISSLEDQWIQLIEDRNTARAEFPRAYCAYETLRTGPLFVAPKELVSSRCDGPLHPMPFNHFGMAEPTQKDDDPYLWAMAKTFEAGATGLTRRKADALVQSADESVLAQEHAIARRAYDEARTLYLELDDRWGEANVLHGLGHLESRLGRNDEARTNYTVSRYLYKAESDRLGEANVLRGLGDLERLLTRYDEARTFYTDARSLYKAVGDRWGEANVLRGLGDLDFLLSRHGEARTFYTDARSLYKAVGNRLGEADVLRGLGDVERLLDHYDEARTAFTQALNLYKAEGNRLGEANVLSGLGDLERHLHRYDEARTAYTDARSLNITVGNRLGEAYVLCGLGHLERLLTRNDEARTTFTEALRLYKAVGNRLGEANVLSGLGHLEVQLHRYDEARTFYTDARSLYKAVGDRLGEANVLLGLGQATVNSELAKQYFYQAALLYEQIGLHNWKEIALNEAKVLSH
jgi:tetratricopeptide (TPR) repeat protein